MKTYDAGIAWLIERTRAMHRSEWSPTPQRKAAESIAERLDELADLLKQRATAQFYIECQHDAPLQPETSADGWPVPADDVGCSYQATIMHMRRLAQSARQVASDLPNPRTKPALPFAAVGLLHLRYCHGYGAPSLYNDGDDVRELQHVAAGAGIVLSPDRLRGALSKALQEFDPHMVPDYLDGLFR